MTQQEKLISKVFDKSVEALGVMTKSICDAIKSTRIDKRYVIYEEQRCEVIAHTDAGETLNTAGIAFCIILPDGTVKNVQETKCKFV